MPDRDSPEPGILIANRSDRLGARLIAIANTMRLARDYGLEYRIHWLRKWELTDPTDLFEKAFVERLFLSTDDYRAWRKRKATPLSIYGADPDHRRMVSVLRSGKGDVEIDTIFDVFRFPNEDEQAVAQSFAKVVASIPFAQCLRPAMEALRTRLSGTKAASIAYHIRRGDLTSDLQAMNRPWENKFVPEQYYERHIERSLGGAAELILFSDDAEILERYTKRYPGLLTFADLIDSGGFTPAQVDFLELYAMSCCARIFAPPASAFSRAAATIGGAQFASVTEDLEPEDRNAALEALCTNLAHHPDRFADLGEIGQSLVHADIYLSENGRKTEIAALMSQYVEQGMSLAFIYALLFQRLFETGQYQEILRMRAFVDAGYVYHRRSWAKVTLYHGCALLMLGHKREGHKQISAAFWHEPTEGEIGALCFALIAQGDLTPQNFWFTDPEMTPYLLNYWSEGHLRDHFTPMIDAGVLSVPTGMGGCRQLVWEWDAFTRPHLNAHFRFRGQFRQLRQMLSLPRAPASKKCHVESYIALAELRNGQAQQALEWAKSALSQRPENPLFHKRVAEALAELGKTEEAIAHMRQAADLGGTARMLHAALGALLMKAGDAAGAAEAYDNALRDGDLTIPTVNFMAAQANLAVGNRQRAETQLANGLELSPVNLEMQLEWADVLEKLGRRDEALQVLRGVFRWASNRPPVVRGLTKLLVKQGNTAEAREIVAQASASHPDKARQFKNILQKLT